MKPGGSISIWFFIGLSLLVNGALILGTGLYELAVPPENPVVLFQYHAGIWLGLVLFTAGAVYCYHFAPSRERARSGS